MQVQVPSRTKQQSVASSLQPQCNLNTPKARHASSSNGYLSETEQVGSWFEVIPVTRRRAVAREGPWRQRGAALLKRRYRSQEISIDAIVHKRQSNFLFHLFLVF